MRLDSVPASVTVCFADHVRVQDDEEKMQLRFQYLYGPLNVPGTGGIIVRNWSGQKSRLSWRTDRSAVALGRMGGGGLAGQCYLCWVAK